MITLKIVADTHTHTVASTHAYGTIKEMIAEASQLGLYAIAVTDHGPTMPGGPREWYFNNFRAIPQTYLGVRVLMGAEANISYLKRNNKVLETAIIAIPRIRHTTRKLETSLHSLMVKCKKTPVLSLQAKSQEFWLSAF